MKLLLLFIMNIVLCGAAAQTPGLDSLKAAADKAEEPSEKLKAILAFCEEYQSLNRDTLDKYAVIARILSEETNDNRSKTLAELAMANSYLRWGWIDSALAAIDPELKKYKPEDPSQRELYFKLSRQKAFCYGARSEYKQALDILYSIANDAEKYNDSLTAGSSLNTIGSIAIARNEPVKALDWTRKAILFLPDKQRYTIHRASTLINMANAYFLLGKIDSAGYFVNQALPLAQKGQSLHLLAVALRVRSSIYLQAGDLLQAEADLKKMLEVRKKIGDNDIYIDDNLQLANFYLNTEQYDKAIEFCNSKIITGNLYAETSEPGKVLNNDIKNRLPYYETLAKAYNAVGNKELYIGTLKNIIAAKDSLYEASSAEALAELQTKYEVQKKENTIIQQKLILARKNYILYGSLIAVAALIVIALMALKNYVKKQKHLSVKAVKEAEEKERVRIAADLHDNLGAYAASIASNLDSIALPQGDPSSAQALQELRFNSKSIVSQLSDTIWALNKESLSVTAISDRVKLLLQRISRSYPGMLMDVKEDISEDILFSSPQGFHLFQIVQEAVTNAVKHSGSKKIEIHIVSAESWKIAIQDEGRGMDEYAIGNAGGNGLFSMAARANASGFRVEWEPNLPSGTIVSIIPTPN